MAAEQQHLRQLIELFAISDLWYQTPALLKQWFDAALEYGWAYSTEMFFVKSDLAASFVQLMMITNFKVVFTQLLKGFKPIVTINTQV